MATGYTGTVVLTSTDPLAVLPSNYTFSASDAGRHSFTVTLDTSGVQTIAATDSVTASITGTESGIAVKAAAAKSFTVAGFPSVVMASAPETVTVTAYDAYGNVATGYAGTVLLTSTDPVALLPSSYRFTATDAGSHQFTVALATAGTQSITAADTADSSISGSETGITVRAIPQITWSAPASIVYGTPLGPAQLDASANVPGTFTFTPAAGSILNAGSGQTLSVVFTPENSTDYTSGSATTTIVVTKATPVLEVTAGGGPLNGSPYSANATIIGAVAGVDQTPSPRLDSIAPMLAYYDGSGTAGTGLGSVPPSVPGTYTALATFPGDANYLAAASAPVTFVIGHAETVAPTSTKVVLVQIPVSRGRKRTAARQSSVRLTVEIEPAAPSVAVPTGEVTFELSKSSRRKRKTITLGKAPVNAGEATLSLRAGKVMRKSITIVYSGDTNDKASSLTTAKLT